MTDAPVTEKAAAPEKDAVASTREVEKTAEKATDRATGAMADTARTAKDKAAATVADGSVDKPPAPPARSLDEIESDLDVTRARLADRLDELADYIAPKNVAQRQLDKVKGVFVDEYGGIKPDRVLMAAGIVVAIVGLRVLRHRHRG